jgi:heat shock protein HtpX
VAVSSGLLQRLKTSEVEGVLGHEIAHVANGDMVTMTLIQGVVNAFVMFLSRAIGFVLAQAIRGNSERDRDSHPGMLYPIISMVLEVIFMILGSIVVAWFSRWREFRADAGGAKYAGRENMVGALQALRRTYELIDPAVQPQVQNLKISSRGSGFFALFSSHPPLEERIARLQALG